MRKWLLIFALSVPYAATAQETANIWVNTTAGTCTRSASPAAYNAATACGTIASAWTIAQGGDLILAKEGVYSSGFSCTGSKSSTVTVRPATGENPEFAGDGDINGCTNLTVTNYSNVVAVGLTMGYTVIFGASANINFNSVHLWCQTQSPWHVVTGSLGQQCSAALHISGVNGFTMTGGSIGPTTDCESAPCSNNTNNSSINGCTSNAACNNINFVNVVFHDHIPLDSVTHSEFWKIDQGQNISFKRNVFKHIICNTAVIFFGQFGTNDTPDILTFEQNAIPACELYGGGYGIEYAYNQPSNKALTATFKYNTLGGGSMSVDTVVSNGANIRFEGNTAWRQSFQGCFPSGATFIKNLWYTDPGTIPAQCGTDNAGFQNDPNFWVSPGPPNYDLHPLTGSLLIDKGGNGCAGLVDPSGVSRPQGAACDVGAYEFTSGGGGPAPPTGLTAASH